MKKKKVLDVSMIVYKEEGDITEKDLRKFSIKFIDLVEKLNMCSGGGIKITSIEE